MMYIKYLSIFLFFLPFLGHAQRIKSIEVVPEIGVGIALPQGVNNVSGGQNLTSSFRFSYLGQVVGSNGQVQTQWLFPRNAGLSLAFRLHDMDMNGSWAIRAGIHRSLVAYYFREPIANVPNFTEANWLKDIKYTSYSLDVQRDFGKYYAQLGARYATNISQDGDALGNDTTIYDYSTTTLKKLVEVVPLRSHNIIICPEIGQRGVYMNTVPYEIGIGIQASAAKMFSEKMDYVMSNGSTAESVIKYGVSAVFLNVKVPITIAKFPKPSMPTANNTKKEKPSKVEPPKPAKPKKEVVVAHKEKPPKVEKPKPVKPKKEIVADNDKPKVKEKEEKEPKQPKVKDKKAARYRVTHTINVQNRNVKVIVKDPNAEDGDIISLYLNGYPLLQDYKVLKKEKVIEITLDEGDNHLIMRALNVGRIPPNTASVTVDDGKSKQSVTLSAQEKKNVALKIVCRK